MVIALVVMVGGHGGHRRIGGHGDRWCCHGYCGGGGGIGGGWWWLSSLASWRQLLLLGAVVAESAEGRWWLQYVENG